MLLICASSMISMTLRTALGFVLVIILLLKPIEFILAQPSKKPSDMLFPVISRTNYRNFGFIDSDGNQIIAPTFPIEGNLGDDVYPSLGIYPVVEFSDGRARIQVGDFFVFIDVSGEVVIEGNFVEAENFVDGLALVTELTDENNQKSYFIDVDGKRVFDLRSSIDIIDQFSEGLAEIGTKASRRYLRGFIDKRGQIAIEPKYEQVSAFSEGISLVKMNDKWGAIDPSGRILIEPQYDDIKNFSNGLAAMSKNGRWGFVNKYGAVVVPPTYSRVGQFSDGIAAVKTPQGKLAFINSSGTIILKTRFNFVDEMLIMDTYRFECGGPPAVFDYEPRFSEGLCPVSIGDKWGFIDISGKTVIFPKFNAVDDYYDGLSRVLIGNKIGFIDHTGRIVLGPYPYMSDFQHGLSLVFTQWRQDNAEEPEVDMCLSDHRISYSYVTRRGKAVYSSNYRGREYTPHAGGGGGDFGFEPPRPVPLRITSVPEGATIYVIPWTLWKPLGEKSINSCQECRQPRPSNAVLCVQQQRYMVVMKKEKESWGAPINVTDSGINPDIKDPCTDSTLGSNDVIWNIPK